jgi:hypothetical protein
MWMPKARVVNHAIAVRRQLADTIAVDLPVLEQAVQAGDYEVAFARAAAIRATRVRVRAMLAGGDPAGTLRSEWTKIEPRIEAALAAAPRPNGKPGAGRRDWAGDRLARGSASPVRRQPRTTAPMRAVAGALAGEVYYPAAPPEVERRSRRGSKSP